MNDRFCFLTERQVGIGSAAGAIEPFVRGAGHDWCDVTYVEPNGMIERLPLPKRVGGTLRGFLQVKAALRKEYEALLFLTHNPAVFHQGVLERIPTVLWTDVTPAQLDLQAEHYGHPVERFRLAGRLKREIVRKTFLKARFCAAWSDWARRSFVEDYGVPEERTVVVHPGIDLERWKLPIREKRNAIPRLLFVGGDFERKGGSLLLEVFREQFRGRAELDLVTRDAVSSEVGVRVHHGLNAGSEALLALYRQADVFVLPTQGDCFSIASMEAMAMGLPVVTTDVGGISEIVVPGKTGYIVPPREGRPLKEAIEKLLADPEETGGFGLLGRARVEEKFSAEKTAASLVALTARAKSSAKVLH